MALLRREGVEAPAHVGVEPDGALVGHAEAEELQADLGLELALRGPRQHGVPESRQSPFLGPVRRVRVELELDLGVGVGEVVGVELQEQTTCDVRPPGKIPFVHERSPHVEEDRPDLRPVRGHHRTLRGESTLRLTAEPVRLRGERMAALGRAASADPRVGREDDPPNRPLPRRRRGGRRRTWLGARRCDQATLTLTMSEWRSRIARATLRFLPAFPIARAFQAGSTVTVAWRPFPFGERSTRFGEYQ